MNALNIVKADEKGRINLGKKITDTYGMEFVIVKAINEIILFPLPKDPIKTLQEEGKKLPKISINELRKEIIKQAYKNI